MAQSLYFFAIVDAIRKYNLTSLFRIKIILVVNKVDIAYSSAMIKIFLFETNLFNRTSLSHR
jgi:hypothetical protein